MIASQVTLVPGSMFLLNLYTVTWEAQRIQDNVNIEDAMLN